MILLILEQVILH